MRITSFTFLIGISVFLFSSCGENKNEKSADSIIPIADTNAGKTTGMNQTDSVPAFDEAELTEADKQKTTGTWVQMQSGELYATLVCKYESGSIRYSLMKGNETKAMLEGTADNINDSEWFEGQDLDCSLQFEFDKEKFTVKMSKDECKKSNMDFSGVYTRK